jgi:hypothetical protein
LEDFSRNLFEALADGPAVHGLKREDLEEKKIQGALDEIRRLTQVLTSVTELRVLKLPSVSKGKDLAGVRGGVGSVWSD